jgi:serine/threonine-protein kinase HipA
VPAHRAAIASNLLTVWLYGRELAELERLRTGRLRLRFTADAVRTYGLDSCPLSLSLPVSDRRMDPPELERYLDNLLPESPLRGALERTSGIRPGDVFGLLSVIGHECAGAVQFTAPGETPGAGWLRPLSSDEVGHLVRDLPMLDPPDDLPISASLGGIQAKVLLARTPDGWAWPADGALSTHLIKPEPIAAGAVRDLVRLEEWTLRMAAVAGLPSARAYVDDFDGRTAIVVERFDRTGGKRSHQEDFAQALGLAVSDKYESSTAGASRLRRIAGAAGAQALDEQAFRRDLLRAVAFHAIIGNGDAHAKNYSLLINEGGRYSLAPLYDVAPVFLIEARYRHAGHAVNGQVDLRHITAAHLVDEAVGWGLPRELARDAVVEVAQAVQVAAQTTAADDRIAFIGELVSSRAERFAAQA